MLHLDVSMLKGYDMAVNNAAAGVWEEKQSRKHQIIGTSDLAVQNMTGSLQT